MTATALTPRWRLHLIYVNAGVSVLALGYAYTTLEWTYSTIMLSPFLALIFGPLFAWALLAQTKVRAWAVNGVMWAALVVSLVLSQLVLSEPAILRPPFIDWAVPFLVVSCAAYVAGLAVPPMPDASARMKGISIGLIAASLVMAGCGYGVVTSRDGDDTAVVLPKPEELGLPAPWQVIERDTCRRDVCTNINVEIRHRDGHFTIADLRQELSRAGWQEQQCRPIGGLLTRISPIDWGDHCLGRIADTGAGFFMEVRITARRGGTAAP